MGLIEPGLVLNHMLTSIAPDGVSEPTIAVPTRGIYNSAYFEHSFLAHRIGAALVEGIDLVIGDDDGENMRTIDGLERDHVIYRRVDDPYIDPYIDPEVFREDSTPGVPGPMRAWRASNVGIAAGARADAALRHVTVGWGRDCDDVAPVRGVVIGPPVGKR